MDPAHIAGSIGLLLSLTLRPFDGDAIVFGDKGIQGRGGDVILAAHSDGGERVHHQAGFGTADAEYRLQVGHVQELRRVVVDVRSLVGHGSPLP